MAGHVAFQVNILTVAHGDDQGQSKIPQVALRVHPDSSDIQAMPLYFHPLLRLPSLVESLLDQAGIHGPAPLAGMTTTSFWSMS